jgi:multiple sugar transport system permease protein
MPGLGWRIATHAAVYAGAMTMVAPFVWMVVTALKTDAEVLDPEGRLLPRTLEFGNFARAAASASLGRFVVNSLVAAAVTTVLAVAYNAMAGFAFAKMRFRGKRLLFGAVMLTMMLPMQVYFLFTYLLCVRLGFIDNYQALIVPFLASGFGVFYMRQAIAAVPDALLEAGRLDGMSDWELFWTIVRPSVWPSLAALGIFSFVNSWNSFFWPLVVIDSDAMKTMPLAIAELASGQYVQSWPVRMAAATLLTLPLIVLFVAFQKAFVRGISLTGMKE